VKLALLPAKSVNLLQQLPLLNNPTDAGKSDGGASSGLPDTVKLALSPPKSVNLLQQLPLLKNPTDAGRSDGDASSGLPDTVKLELSPAQSVNLLQQLPLLKNPANTGKSDPTDAGKSDPNDQDKQIQLQFPFVVERSFTTFFHMDSSSMSMYSATHAITQLLPEQMTSLINFYFVPTLEFDLPHAVHDFEALVMKLVTAHLILTAQYSKQRKLTIRSHEFDCRDYYSWDGDLDSARHAVLGMYERPLFHIIGHRARAWHKHGPAVRITVVWHHIIMDVYSEYVIERDICALARGETLLGSNLATYISISRNPLATARIEAHKFTTFSLTPQATCSVMPLVGKVAHSVGMFAAVTREPFGSDIDRLTYFLDAWCECTGQMQGRFGIVTNARTKMDEDASNLIGALLYILEFAYDSTNGQLTPLNGSMDDNQLGMVINMYPTPEKAESIISCMGFADPAAVVAGETEASIQEVMSGALGTDFADVKHLYTEVLSTVDGTCFSGIYPHRWFDGRDEICALQQKLARPQGP
jgi:hypothetical protein